MYACSICWWGQYPCSGVPANNTSTRWTSHPADALSSMALILTARGKASVNQGGTGKPSSKALKFSLTSDRLNFLSKFKTWEGSDSTNLQGRESMNTDHRTPTLNLRLRTELSSQARLSHSRRSAQTKCNLRSCSGMRRAKSKGEMPRFTYSCWSLSFGEKHDLFATTVSPLASSLITFKESRKALLYLEPWKASASGPGLRGEDGYSSKQLLTVASASSY